jgi:multiple sugar transport system substrate-binding protein
MHRTAPSKAQNEWFTKLAVDWEKEKGQKVELEYIPAAAYSSGSKLQSSFSAHEGLDIFRVNSGGFMR